MMLFPRPIYEALLDPVLGSKLFEEDFSEYRGNIPTQLVASELERLAEHQEILQGEINRINKHLIKLGLKEITAEKNNLEAQMESLRGEAENLERLGYFVIKDGVYVPDSAILDTQTLPIKSDYGGSKQSNHTYLIKLREGRVASLAEIAQSPQDFKDVFVIAEGNVVGSVSERGDIFFNLEDSSTGRGLVNAYLYRRHRVTPVEVLKHDEVLPHCEIIGNRLILSYLDISKTKGTRVAVGGTLDRHGQFDVDNLMTNVGDEKRVFSYVKSPNYSY